MYILLMIRVILDSPFSKTAVGCSRQHPSKHNWVSLSQSSLSIQGDNPFSQSQALQHTLVFRYGGLLIENKIMLKIDRGL